MQENQVVYDFLLDNDFFTIIDAPEIQKGKVNVKLIVKKTSQAFEFNFQTEGVVWVPCDRCLDEMEQVIVSTDKLMVKFGHEYTEEADNLVIIPEEEGEINIAWFMYEFVALALPMKHVHAPGKCNKAMASKLSKHIRVAAEDDEVFEMDFHEEAENDNLEEETTTVDPRWNELKKILDNN